MNTNKSENIGDKAPSKLPPDKHETCTLVAGTSKIQGKSPLDGYFGTIRRLAHNPAGESQPRW